MCDELTEAENAAWLSRRQFGAAGASVAMMAAVPGCMAQETPGTLPVKGRAVTVTVRPEQVRLVDASEAGAIPATVQSLVYFGTDTHCHMALSDGTEVVARLQSSATGEAALAEGQKVAFRFAAGAVQVLED